MSDDTLKSRLAFDKKLTTCRKCGGALSHRSRGEYICETCGAVEYDDFGKVCRFIDENGPSPAVIISEGTGVPISIINGFLREGRIEIPNGSEVYIQCERCGTEIRFGRFCQACAAKLTKDLAGAFAVSGEAPRKMNKQQGRMHFLNKDS